LERQTVILITLVIYQLALVAIGFWAQRRTRDNQDFFLGGRGLGAIVGSVSYAASSSSAWMLIGYSGAAFTLGLPAFWFIPCTALGHYISWKWIAPRLMAMSKEDNLLTVTDLLIGDAKGHIRTAIVVCASLFILISFSFYVAAQFNASATTFSNSFTISYENSVFLGAGIILIYTMLGGFWAVSITDTLQGLLMIIVSAILPVVALSAVGGPAGLMAGLEAKVTASQLSLTGDDSPVLFMGFFMGVLGLGFGALGQPQLLTRFMALRDDKALRQGRIIATTWFVFVLSAMFIVGLCGHVLLGEVEDPESVFFGLTNSLLPAVLAGVVSAAVLSAIMSTADSQLLVAASAVSHDLGLGRQSRLSPIVISRIVIALLCVISVWITLQLPSDIFSRVLFAWSALGCAFGPIVVVRAIGYNTRPSAILAAMIVGFGLTVYFSNFPQQPSPGVFERVVPFVMGLAILFAFPRERGSVATDAPAE
jgi:sodium/proline symporter